MDTRPLVELMLFCIMNAILLNILVHNDGSFDVSATPAFSDNTQMGLTLNRYQGENGVPQRTDSDSSDPFNKKPKYERLNDMDGFSAQAAFSHDIDNPFGLRGWVYMNRQDMLYIVVD